ncbi:MAG TPA: hypothetical protein VFQ65_23310, partial [Kofleriaceae bacterium]|nr:hypothetical protein [Kofleriaceae bacterium]
AYQTATPPFDSNTMVTGLAAAAPSLQLDGAAQWFDAGRSTLGRAVWYGDDAKVHDTGFKWATAGYRNASFSRFSGFTNVNPRTVAGPGPAQRAIVSLVDMGRYSTGHLGRTIARTLHDLVAAEPKDNDIRVFNQAICRAGDHVVDGNCAGRSEQTYIGRLVYRALTAARLGWATNVWVMTSSSRPQNDGYPSPYSFNVRSMLYETALAQVCVEDDDYWSFQPGWDQLKFFNNPRGRGSCWAAVTRAINGRFHYRTVTAFMNGTTGRQWAGVHHKLVMFGREAMFQGSFNAYPSEVSSDVSTTYDSKLVENGAIILDPDYVNDQVSAFDEAWATASPIIGGE